MYDFIFQTIDDIFLHNNLCVILSVQPGLITAMGLPRGTNLTLCIQIWSLKFKYIITWNSDWPYLETWTLEMLKKYNFSIHIFDYQFSRCHVMIIDLFLKDNPRIFFQLWFNDAHRWNQGHANQPFVISTPLWVWRVVWAFWGENSWCVKINKLTNFCLAALVFLKISQWLHSRVLSQILKPESDDLFIEIVACL